MGKRLTSTMCLAKVTVTTNAHPSCASQLCRTPGHRAIYICIQLLIYVSKTTPRQPELSCQRHGPVLSRLRMPTQSLLPAASQA